MSKVKSNFGEISKEISVVANKLGQRKFCFIVRTCKGKM